MSHLTDSTGHALLALINDDIASDRKQPALENASDELKQKGIIVVSRVLNVMRKLASDVLHGVCVTGNDGEISSEELDDDLDELLDELVAVGAEVTEHGDIREDFALFYKALKNHHEDLSATTQQVVKSLATEEEDGRLSIQAISKGRRVCRALVGVGNRIGLLAELTVANIIEDKIHVPAFFDRMQLIAKHARSIDGQETFRAFIKKQINVSCKHIPPPYQIGCMANVNAVASLCNAIVEQAPDPATNLTSRLPTCETATNHAQTLSKKIKKDAEFRLMVQSLPLFHAIADAIASQSNENRDALVTKLGEKESHRLLRCAQDHEHYVALTDAVEDAVLTHYPKT